MTVFHRKWKFIFDWQLIDASAAIKNDSCGKDCLWESLHIYRFRKRSMSVYVIFLSLEPGYLSYYFAMETHSPWANSKKRKKRKTQKTRKAWQRKHVVASLHQTKVLIIGNDRQNLPFTRKVSERAGKIFLERKKEGYWMFGLILIAIVTLNRQTIVMKTTV